MCLIWFCFSIQANSPVMELDHVFGTLNILYSDRLVTLLREVRQLSALGFVIPAKIQHVANTAQKFSKQAVILKQVKVKCHNNFLFWFSIFSSRTLPDYYLFRLNVLLSFLLIVGHFSPIGKEVGCF